MFAFVNSHGYIYNSATGYVYCVNSIKQMQHTPTPLSTLRTDYLCHTPHHSVDWSSGQTRNAKAHITYTHNPPPPNHPQKVQPDTTCVNKYRANICTNNWNGCFFTILLYARCAFPERLPLNCLHRFSRGPSLLLAITQFVWSENYASYIWDLDGFVGVV